MKKLIFIGFLILAVSLWTAPAKAAQSGQLPLNPKTIPQFAQPLPVLSVAPGGTINTVFGNQPLTIRMCEFDAKVLPPGTIVAGLQPTTRVWGYLVDPNPTAANPCARLIDLYDDGIVNQSAKPLNTYTGPVILNTRGTGGTGSTDITWVNNLPTVDQTGVQAWKFSTDVTLHWADPLNAEANNCAKGGIPPFGSECASNYGQTPGTNTFFSAPIAGAVHLHGGEVPPGLDGGPDSWFTATGLRGHGYYSAAGAPTGGAIYKYPNTQEASPIWFHDHVLGATRLNVYAGLAGGYIISDPTLVLPAGLHAYGLLNGPPATPGGPATLEPTIPLVIQDRMFDTTGQLFFPADTAAGVLWSLNPEHPYWVPEFVGDTIVVNGKAWPFLNVQAKRYRFLFLNGSNARTYVLNIPGGPKMYVIGTDGGYLDAPQPIKTLTIMPGERYEVIIDFTGLKGNFIMNNSGKTPFPRGAQPAGATVGRIMQFRVGPVPVTVPPFVDTSYNPAAVGACIRGGAAGSPCPAPPIVRLVNTATGTPATGVTVNKTRLLTLNEVLALPSNTIDPVTGLATAYPGGPIEILVNNSKWTGNPATTNCSRGDFTPRTFPSQSGGSSVTQCYSELPNEGETELWEIVNLTADAHPIHLHLVQFQIMNRQNFDVAKYTAAYNLAFAGAPAPLPLNCPINTYCPGYGPPLDYNTGNPAALGGNPPVTPYLAKAIVLPALEEQGWKDTVVAMPGMVTRIMVRWAPTDLPNTTLPANAYFPFNPDGNHGFVWHCHIIDHEDNEMMRPNIVIQNPNATRTVTNF